MKRAHETGQIIARPHGLTVVSVDELTEVDVGDWEGRTWEDIAQTEHDAHHRFVTDPGNYGYRGGENLSQVRERVVPAMGRLMTSNVGRQIVVVGHNVVNRVYLAELLGVPLAKARGIDQDNCGVNVIRYRDGRAKASWLNRLRPR